VEFWWRRAAQQNAKITVAAVRSIGRSSAEIQHTTHLTLPIIARYSPRKASIILRSFVANFGSISVSNFQHVGGALLRITKYHSMLRKCHRTPRTPTCRFAEMCATQLEKLTPIIPPRFRAVGHSRVTSQWWYSRAAIIPSSLCGRQRVGGRTTAVPLREPSRVNSSEGGSKPSEEEREHKDPAIELFVCYFAVTASTGCFWQNAVGPARPPRPFAHLTTPALGARTAAVPRMRWRCRRFVFAADCGLRTAVLPWVTSTLLNTCQGGRVAQAAVK
jgi:hypothetical protein